MRRKILDAELARSIALYIGEHPEMLQKDIAKIYNVSQWDVSHSLYDGGLYILDIYRIGPDDDTLTIAEKVAVTYTEVANASGYNCSVNTIIALYNRILRSRSLARQQEARAHLAMRQRLMGE